jgi:hypothetical protein
VRSLLRGLSYPLLSSGAINSIFFGENPISKPHTTHSAYIIELLYIMHGGKIGVSSAGRRKSTVALLAKPRAMIEELRIIYVD